MTRADLARPAGAGGRTYGKKHGWETCTILSLPASFPLMIANVIPVRGKLLRAISVASMRHKYRV